MVSIIRTPNILRIAFHRNPAAESDFNRVPNGRPLGCRGDVAMTRAYCDGVNRRDVIKLGAAGALGLGLDLPGILSARQALADQTGKSARDVSLIFVFLHGGLSTIDTLDMKPDAPSEFRGEFKPIATNVSGIQVCEHLPRLARTMDKFSIVRSFTHPNSNHGQADHYMLTGYPPSAAFNAGLKPNNQKPSHGSTIARKLGPKGSVPAYVCLPKMHPSCGSAYLGSSVAPFEIDADPNAPDFTVPDIVPPPQLEARRLDDRRRLLAQVDRFQKSAEVRANRHAATVDVFRQKAFELMTSSAAKRAFDIAGEPEKLRDDYGRHTLGQSCLMARRLVEAGVRCVTIDHSNWDTHSDNFGSLKRELLPYLDSALSTLLTDLSGRGMLDSTLVVVTGEFGRTPRINKDAGRDHWGPGFSVAVAGGGLKGGIAVGSTDARAEKPADKPYGPEDLCATMYTLMGIDPNHEFYTPEGRPVKVANDGKLIRELL